ncbi:MAG TPA: hypothetical protein VNZ52_16480 [Candidatus Thermoplasmatota archaeon]|nr:hypothetical protein [Candidatus Thermoplasmatota archaeon]
MAPATTASSLSPLKVLGQWGSGLQGEWRLVLYAALGGAAFSLVIWFTAAYAFTGTLTGPAPLQETLLPGVALFALLWGLFGLYAVMGWPRLFLCTLMGHLLGYFVMTINLVLARLSGYDPLMAIATLFGFTALGFLVGAGLEAAVAADRYLHPGK